MSEHKSPLKKMLEVKLQATYDRHRASTKVEEPVVDVTPNTRNLRFSDTVYMDGQDLKSIEYSEEVKFRENDLEHSPGEE